jgi:hypothetical protein
MLISALHLQSISTLFEPPTRRYALFGIKAVFHSHSRILTALQYSRNSLRSLVPRSLLRLPLLSVTMTPPWPFRLALSLPMATKIFTHPPLSLSATPSATSIAHSSVSVNIFLPTSSSFQILFHQKSKPYNSYEKFTKLQLSRN